MNSINKIALGEIIKELMDEGKVEVVCGVYDTYYMRRNKIVRQKYNQIICKTNRRTSRCWNNVIYYDKR